MYKDKSASGVLAYADDIVVWAPAPELLHDLINMVVDKGGEIGLSLNLNKCKTMTRSSIRMPNITTCPMDDVEEFTYLGIRCTTEPGVNFLMTDLDYRCGTLFNSMMENVRKTLGFHYGSLHTRLMLSKALVTSKIFYGQELWPNSSAVKKIVEKDLMVIACQLLGIRTLKPCYKVVVAEAGFDNPDLTRMKKQIDIGIHWDYDLEDTPINLILSRSKDCASDKVWAYYGYRHTMDQYNMNNCQIGDECRLANGDIDYDAEEQAFLNWRCRMLDYLAQQYASQEPEPRIDSTERKYFKEQITRNDFWQCLMHLSGYPYGRRCLHEVRCMCYPVIAYRCRVGWKALESSRCLFCETGEDETLEHMTCRCPAWDTVRKTYLDSYCRFGRKLMMKIVLGYVYTPVEEARIRDQGFEEQVIVNDITRFLQNVDRRRSDILKGLGLDITSRTTNRGGIRQRRRLN